MMGSSDDPSANDPGEDADDDEFQRHGQAIHQLVLDYLEEHDIPDAAGTLLMLDGAITMRMIAYAGEVERPSGSGLKLDLDRFRRDMDDAIRAAKKDADEFIEKIKPVLAAARAAHDAEEGGEE
jgi:hypothetical protein